jgi:hypothetical protein
MVLLDFLESAAQLRQVFNNKKRRSKNATAFYSYKY